jgi:hypothetical protein
MDAHPTDTEHKQSTLTIVEPELLTAGIPSLDQMADDSKRDRDRERQGTIEAAWIGLEQCRRVGYTQGAHGLKGGNLDRYCKERLGLSHSEVDGMKRLVPRLDDAVDIVMAWKRADKKRGKCPT